MLSSLFFVYISEIIVARINEMNMMRRVAGMFLEGRRTNEKTESQKKVQNKKGNPSPT